MGAHEDRDAAPVGPARPGIAESIVATGKGDDGTTGLLYGGPRIPKDDVRTEAFGTIDEAVAALGIARAELKADDPAHDEQPAVAELESIVLRLQRELFVVGSELAVNPEAWDRLQDGVTRVSESMLAGLEALLADLERRITMPTEFIVPGESRGSAAIELARTIVRRAERRAISLQRAGLVAGPWLVPYLNRFADLLWVLGRFAEQIEQRNATLARVGPTARTTKRREREG